MKLSAKKKSEIYDLVHQVISNVRIDLRRNYIKEGYPLRDKIDCVIAQVEIPLAQKIMKLFEGSKRTTSTE